MSYLSLHLVSSGCYVHLDYHRIRIASRHFLKTKSLMIEKDYLIRCSLAWPTYLYISSMHGFGGTRIYSLLYNAKDPLREHIHLDLFTVAFAFKQKSSEGSGPTIQITGNEAAKIIITLPYEPYDTVGFDHIQTIEAFGLTTTSNDCACSGRHRQVSCGTSGSLKTTTLK